jgi:uncharacterized phage-associated protein
MTNQIIDIQKFAQYIVEKFSISGEPLTNKKLQKILYYVEAWHLVYFDSQLFSESPEAWIYGPVYPSVYQKYRKYKANPITIDEDYPIQKINELLESFNFNDEKKEFLFSVLKYYGSRSALELEILTHREKPWLDAREGLSDFENSTTLISKETMKNYYNSLKIKNQSK